MDHVKLYTSTEKRKELAVRVDDSLLHGVEDLFRDLFKTRGHIVPMVIVHSPHGEMAPLPYDGTAADKRAIILTIQQMRKLKLFGAALLISEARMAKVPEGKKPEDADLPRASEDPNREEIAIVQAIYVDGTSVGAVWPIIRDAAGVPSLGKMKKLDAGSVQCWLNDALISEGEYYGRENLRSV